MRQNYVYAWLKRLLYMYIYDNIMLKAVLQNFKFKFNANPRYNLMILNNIKYQLDTHV